MGGKEKRVLAFQSILEALFVSVVDDKSVAVGPMPGSVYSLQQRVDVQRMPAGWRIDRQRIDYDSPDDWSITFAPAFVRLAAKSVGMASLEGDKDVLPTRIVRYWRPYVIAQHRPAAVEG